jgi:cytochrome b
MVVHPVWDLPTRFIHWCFPLGIGFLWWTGETGRMEWHSYGGYTLIVLVTTRFMWGFFGSFHSRFAHFVRGPNAVLAYLKATPDAEPQSIGHNPLGAYSVLALLFAILAQGLSGMFSIDDVAFDGPLAYYFGGEYIDLALQWHDIGWVALQALIVLHLCAIAWYQVKKRRPLVQTMWFGSYAGRESGNAPVSGWRAILTVLTVSGVLAAAIFLAPEAPSYY